MSHGPENDPFALTSANMDEVRAYVVQPIATAMEGWEILEDNGLVTTPSFGRGEDDPEWVWPLQIGLGFGVKLALVVLQSNRPNRNIESALRMYEGAVGGRMAAEQVGWAVGVFAERIHQNPDWMSREVDHNIARNIILYAVDRVSVSPGSREVFLGATAYGFLRVREADDTWELDNPYLALEAISE